MSVVVKLTVAESVSLCQSPIITDLAGTVDDVTTGVVRFEPGTDLTTKPGVYIAEAAVYGSSGTLAFSNQFYVIVERGVKGMTLSASGPPSVSEIRLFLRDSDPKENELLENVQFDLAEIALAIERPVLYWNETQPPIDQRYSTDTFPFRYHWLNAVVGQLFMIAANWYRANHLAYQSGGVSVDDMNKANEYEQIAQLRWREYADWVLKKKVQLNAESAIQSSDSWYMWS